MISPSEFENAVLAIFTRKGTRGVSESPLLVKTCLAIYDQTIAKNREWVTRVELANAVYGDVDEFAIDMIKKNIARIRNRLKECFNSPDILDGISAFEITDSQKTAAAVRDNKSRLVVAYKLAFSPIREKNNSPQQSHVSGFPEKYPGRKYESDSVSTNADKLRSIKGVILAETLAIKEKAQRYLDGNSILEELRASTPMLTSIVLELSNLKTEQIIAYRRAITLDMEMKKTGNKDKLLAAIRVCDDLIASLEK